VSLELGAQISWPTISGDNYQLQWGNGAAWNNLVSQTAGTGVSSSIFDPAYPSAHSNYRVQEVGPSGGVSIVVNGGVESGTGSSATGWSQVGGEPPLRVSSAAHSGSYSMQIYVTNTASTPNNGEIDQDMGRRAGQQSRRARLTFFRSGR